MPKQVFQAQNQFFLRCYPSRICIYLCLWILSRYILTLRGKRFARERPHTSKLGACAQNRGFNRGSRAVEEPTHAATPRVAATLRHKSTGAVTQRHDVTHAAAASQATLAPELLYMMGLGFNLGWERQRLRDDARSNAEIEAKPMPAFRSRAPSFRREELRRERATEPEPAPLLLERFLMPVAAAPKE